MDPRNRQKPNKGYMVFRPPTLEYICRRVVGGVEGDTLCISALPCLYPQKVPRLWGECGVDCAVEQPQAGRIAYFIPAYLRMWCTHVVPVEFGSRERSGVLMQPQGGARSTTGFSRKPPHWGLLETQPPAGRTVALLLLSACVAVIVEGAQV